MNIIHECKNGHRLSPVGWIDNAGDMRFLVMECEQCPKPKPTEACAVCGGAMETPFYSNLGEICCSPGCMTHRNRWNHIEACGNGHQ